MRVLMNYAWPGNIRQLENAIEHAVAMTGAEKEITPRTLPEDVAQPAASMLLPSVTIPDEGINFTSVVSQLERELILRCLEKTGGNKRQAARLLQLSRTTLIDKLHRLNLGGPGVVPASSVGCRGRSPGTTGTGCGATGTGCGAGASAPASASHLATRLSSASSSSVTPVRAGPARRWRRGQRRRAPACRRARPQSPLPP